MNVGARVFVSVDVCGAGYLYALYIDVVASCRCTCNRKSINANSTQNTKRLPLMRLMCAIPSASGIVAGKHDAGEQVEARDGKNS